MAPKPAQGRLVSGIITLGLIAAGIALTPAASAVGSDPTVNADVPLSKTVSASSSLPGFPVGNSIDGNQASYWESTNHAFPQWIQADLGSAKQVGGIVLKLPVSWGARVQTLAVQGSTNGTSFTGVVGSTGYNFTPASANTVTIPVTATTRFVRLNITANTGWPAAQVAEFELYGPDGGTGDTQPPTAPGNLTLTEPSAGQIRLAWTASTDDVGVSGYVVFRNNTAVTTVAGTVLTYTESQPTTATVEYFVRARDARCPSPGRR